MSRPPAHRLALAPAPAPSDLPPGADLPPGELDRREAMKLLAAAASLAGVGSLAGCMQRPSEPILPRVEQPPEMTPGVPLEYATSMVIDGYATGLVVKALEARPIKIEGNPDHPASLGGTNAFHQAALLELYDPHRARGARAGGAPAALDTLVQILAREAAIPGLWFLLPPQSSPLVEELMARVRARHPGVRFAFDAPLGRRQVHAGAQLAFGRPLEAQYRFDRAKVVVSLDADFLTATPNAVRWARDFAAARRPGWPIGEPSRLYVAEARPGPTGSVADHRLAVRPSAIHGLATTLLGAVSAPPGASRGRGALAGDRGAWVEAAAADLRAAGGLGLVVVGDRQPAAVHALGHAINQAIGAVGRTVFFTRSALIDPLGEGIHELVTAIGAGRVGTLVIADANPLYTAAPGLDLRGLLARVPRSIAAGLAESETSRACQQFLPLTHFLESWGDARAHDGTISLVQPLIRPLAPGLSVPELLAVFAGDPAPSGHRMLRALHARGADPVEAELAWRRLLQRGLVEGSAFPVEDVELRPPGRALHPAPAVPLAAGSCEVALVASHATHDGRFAGNPWLQELPGPLDKITWGNAAHLAPATARALGVETGDLVRVERGGQRVELPAFVQPGHAERCVSIAVGYGREAGGPIAEGVGVRAYGLAALDGGAVAARVARTGARGELAVTQDPWDRAGRRSARHAARAAYRARPDFTAAHRGDLPSMLGDAGVDPDAPRWGMTIDTTICSGCSACVVACQAENNVPVVGREQVLAGREMHWLRIDTYRIEVGGRVDHVHQPMLCQHCEKAPCEYVCPVYATQHSPDGLNEMIYNRCIGTRFCSNNCPYKVRRFNWFDFTEGAPETIQLQRNPNVTVRARGVMEKCTYCVQRIRGAEIAARRERREIRPGEVVTACQQACPAGAIQFGQLQHADTPVARWRAEPRRYDVLHELDTRPRTAYLARIRNPRPEPDR